MDRSLNSVVIVDGYSTGSFYMPLLKERGVPIIHVRSTPDTLNAHITDIANDSLKKNASFYTALVDGAQPIEKIAEELNRYQPAAVIPGCETGVELADQLAHFLKLPGNDFASSHARRDKFLMYEAVSNAGIHHLDYGRFTTLSPLLSWIKDKGKFPVVIKPARSAGADGLYICRSLVEATRAFANLIGAATIFGEPITAVIAQEYASGYEIVVNTVSCKGWHRVTDLWRYSKTETPDGRSVYDGVELVPDFGEATDEILRYATAVLDALKISVGAAHIEIMVTADGPVLIECGARAMGGSFSQTLLRSCLGYTQLEMSLDAYLSPDTFRTRWDYPYTLRRYALFKFLSSVREGALDAIPGVTLLAGLPSVKGGNFLACLESGEVERTVDLFTSPADIYLCHEDRNVLLEDFTLIRELEKEAQNLLFEMAPDKDQGRNPEWFLELPDDLWLKPEEAGKMDADTIWDALQLREGMDVLDCPCGDARVGIHLVRRGVRLTGIDANTRFIEKARSRFAAEGLHGDFSVGDMRDIHFEGRFDAIVNWFNSFGYFDIETDFYVLKLFWKALRPGGLLLIESPNRNNIIANTRNITQKDGHELLRHWDELTERLYAPVEIDQNGEKKKVWISTRMYSVAQYRLLFRLARFEPVSMYDENLNAFHEEARRVIFVVRKT
jgi:biotin carboxylase/SAM-dependent methyltransferase